MVKLFWWYPLLEEALGGSSGDVLVAGQISVASFLVWFQLCGRLRNGSAAPKVQEQRCSDEGKGESHAAADDDQRERGPAEVMRGGWRPGVNDGCGRRCDDGRGAGARCGCWRWCGGGDDGNGF